MVDIHSILIVGGFTLAGLVIAYGSKRLNLITESPLLIVLILLPLIVFLADRITEISGGGVKITLAKARTTSVETVATRADTLATRKVIAVCKDPVLNPVAVAFAAGCTYLVLKADYGDATEEEAAERAWVLGHFIQNAIKFGRFRLLVVTDAEGRVLGYFDRDTFLDLLPVQYEQIKSEKTQALAMSRQQADFLIRQSLLFEIARLPRTKARDAKQTYLHPSDNLVEALDVLYRNGLSAAPVVDRAGRLTGIATREDVVAAMLLTLAGEKP